MENIVSGGLGLPSSSSSGLGSSRSLIWITQIANPRLYDSPLGVGPITLTWLHSLAIVDGAFRSLLRISNMLTIADDVGCLRLFHFLFLHVHVPEDSSIALEFRWFLLFLLYFGKTYGFWDGEGV